MNVLKLVKTVHIIGVAMFLGSIFAHIAAGSGTAEALATLTAGKPRLGQPS
jgi:hypothetical protein